MAKKANTLGGALNACRVSTGLDHLSFANGLLSRGFHAACAANASGAQDAQKLADELQQIEDHDVCQMTDAELGNLLTCCRQWLTTPNQQTALAALRLAIGICVLRHSNLPAITQSSPEDP